MSWFVLSLPFPVQVFSALLFCAFSWRQSSLCLIVILLRSPWPVRRMTLCRDHRDDVVNSTHLALVISCARRASIEETAKDDVRDWWSFLLYVDMLNLLLARPMIWRWWRQEVWVFSTHGVKRPWMQQVMLPLAWSRDGRVIVWSPPFRLESLQKEDIAGSCGFCGNSKLSFQTWRQAMRSSSITLEILLGAWCVCVCVYVVNSSCKQGSEAYARTILAISW